MAAASILFHSLESDANQTVPDRVQRHPLRRVLAPQTVPEREPPDHRGLSGAAAGELRGTAALGRIQPRPTAPAAAALPLPLREPRQQVQPLPQPLPHPLLGRSSLPE